MKRCFFLGLALCTLPLFAMLDKKDVVDSRNSCGFGETSQQAVDDLALRLAREARSSITVEYDQELGAFILVWPNQDQDVVTVIEKWNTELGRETYAACADY